MEDITRRTTLALGVAATSALALRAEAATYKPDEGKLLVEGVRQVDLSERDSILPGYKTVKMRDIVFQPGAKTPESNKMKNAMVCHMTEGELKVVQDGKEFAAKKGDVWTCNVGTMEYGVNEGSTAAVMRVTDLIA